MCKYQFSMRKLIVHLVLILVLGINSLSGQIVGESKKTTKLLLPPTENKAPSLLSPKKHKQFLSEDHPKAIGLSVPGMPLGSPGMEVEDRFMPYDVLVLFKDGTSKVYAEVRQ